MEPNESNFLSIYLHDLITRFFIYGCWISSLANNSLKLNLHIQTSNLLVLWTKDFNLSRPKNRTFLAAWYSIMRSPDQGGKKTFVFLNNLRKWKHCHTVTIPVTRSARYMLTQKKKIFLGYKYLKECIIVLTLSLDPTPNLASSLRLKSSVQFPYCSLEEADKSSNASKAYRRNLKIKTLIIVRKGNVHIHTSKQQSTARRCFQESQSPLG